MLPSYVVAHVFVYNQVGTKHLPLLVTEGPGSYKLHMCEVRSNGPHVTCCTNEGFPAVRTEQSAEMAEAARSTVVCACQTVIEPLPCQGHFHTLSSNLYDIRTSCSNSL